MSQEYIKQQKALKKLSGCKLINQVTYIFGATGYGKTELVKQFLLHEEYIYFSCMENLWESEELPCATENDIQTVVIDDLHMLQNEEKRREVLEMANRDDIWLILISRSNIPLWLRETYIKRNFVLISEKDLALTKKEIYNYFEENQIVVEPDTLDFIVSRSEGNSFVVKAVAAEMANGENSTENLNSVVLKYYMEVLEDKVFLWLDSDVRDFLTKVSIVDSFTIGLAEMITGNRNVSEVLQRAEESGNFIYNRNGVYFIRSQMCMALKRRLEQKYSRKEIENLCYNAAMYYEMNNMEAKAFELYAKCNNTDKIKDMLIRNSMKCPEDGYYYEMRKYYLMLSESDIESQYLLMVAMAMLYSLIMNEEKSEYWYNKLKEYGRNTKGAEKREIIASIAYLDIAMPHRGSFNLLELIKNSYKLFHEKSISFPKFSVTSNMPSIMNGGKDFCEWSKNDREILRNAGKILASFLGKHGNSLVSLALAESFYEKGGDDYEVSSLISRGKLETESGYGEYTMLFVAAGLQARRYISKGAINEAKGIVEQFCKRTEKTEKAYKLMPNIYALQCRIALYEGDKNKVSQWMRISAPDENDFFVMERYRYLTKIRCYIAAENYGFAYDLIEMMRYYAEKCDRKYISMELGLLTAIIKYRRNSEWKTEFVETLRRISEYKFIRIISEEGAAVYPLLNEVRKEFLADEKMSDWYKRVLDETHKMSLNYPVYLKTEITEIPQLSVVATEILKMQSDGYSITQIAKMLEMTPRNVKYHAENTYKKLGVNSKTDAILTAKNLNII